MPSSDGEYELSGKGWIIGFKDLSTFPLGLFSLALQTGLWYANTPVNTLKENFPSIKIHWIVSNGFEDILTKHPLIDRVIVINKDKWKSFKHLDFTIKEFSKK